MNLDALQLDVHDRLAANTALAGLDVFIEFDPRKTPAELATQDAEFERALATKGLAIVILSPFGRPADSVQRAVAWAMTVPVAVVENIEVNRAAADPLATPALTPSGLAPLRVQQHVIVALLPAYKFPASAAIERPTIGADGLVHYYLLPERSVSVL